MLVDPLVWLSADATLRRRDEAAMSTGVSRARNGGHGSGRDRARPGAGRARRIGLTATSAVGLIAALLMAPAALGGPTSPGSSATSVATAGSTAPKRTDYREVKETLKAEIPALLEQTGVVGATVALVAGDRVVMARGFGWADRAKRRPVTSRTLFHIGSISKTFAAISVMQLVERRRVKLDARLSRYVPQLRLLPRFNRNKITVRSVLDHHSGIPGDIFYRLMTMKRTDPGFQRWLLTTLRTMPPERRVNTGWAYNNSGYVLLKPLVENVTGQEYASRTRRTLFQRMGMRSSSFDDTLARSRAMTRNYSPVVGPDGQPTGKVKADPREYVNGWTAGSVLSSAKDMAKYLQTLIAGGRGRNGRVLKAATLRRMTTPQLDLPLDRPTQNGLSFFRHNSWMGRAFGHDGATTRNFSNLFVLPGQDLGVFVSTNTVGGLTVAESVSARALELMYTAKTGIPKPPPVTLPDRGPRTPTQQELAAAAGRYAGYTSYVEIEPDGKRLQYTTHGSEAPSTIGFTLMADGWWKTDADPNVQIAFRRVQGKSVLVYRNAGGTAIIPMILGMRARPIDIPRRWRRAAGEYRFAAAHPSDLVPPVVYLRPGDRFAELVLGEDGSPQERQVLLPIEGTTAYTFGWAVNGGRRKGDVVRLTGDRLTYMGVTYRKTD